MREFLSKPDVSEQPSEDFGEVAGPLFALRLSAYRFHVGAAAPFTTQTQTSKRTKPYKPGRDAIPLRVLTVLR